MTILDTIKGWFMRRFDIKDIERSFHVKVASDLNMTELIRDWMQIYQGSPCWVGEDKTQIDASLNLASTVCSDLAIKCISELNIGAVKDKALQEFWEQEVKDEIRQQLECGLASGAFVIRPYYDSSKNRISLSWYTADKFIPISWDGRKCMGGIFIDQDVVHSATKGNVYYTKMECHKWEWKPLSDGTLTGAVEITIKAFKSTDPTDISKEIPLTDVDKWATIPAETRIENTSTPLFVYCPMPFTNNKAFGCKAGVSLYKDGVAILEELDRIWDNLKWERESTQHKLFVDLQMMQTERTEDGYLRVKMDDREKRLYKVIDANGAVSKYMDEYSPAIRQADITQMLKTNLSLLCSNIHLDAGQYIFDEAKQAITAKEITAKEQKTAQTIADIQNWCIAPALTDLFKTVENIQSLYGLTVFDSSDVAIDFGDSILIDEESNKENAQRECSQGLRSKLSYLMEYRGLSEQDAMAEIQRIEAETPVATDFFGNSFNG